MIKTHTNILRSVREDRDLKQANIAVVIGITQQQYSNYETGESELPLHTLETLAGYYNLSTDYLLGRTNCKEGVAALNRMVGRDCTVGELISDVLSLDMASREAVLDFVGFQKMKHRNAKTEEMVHPRR